MSKLEQAWKSYKKAIELFHPYCTGEKKQLTNTGQLFVCMLSHYLGLVVTMKTTKQSKIGFLEKNINTNRLFVYFKHM